MKKNLSIILCALILLGCLTGCGPKPLPTAGSSVSKTETDDSGQSADAEEPERKIHRSGDYIYDILEDGTAEITEYTGEAEDLVIPDILDGFVVSSIGDGAFEYSYCLKSVMIPDSVTSIGANPFLGCIGLNSIEVSPDHPALAVIDEVLFSKEDKRLVCLPRELYTSSYEIPQGTVIIGNNAFYDCDYLSSVTFPDSVTSIGAEAFSYCDGLKTVTIPDSVISVGVNPFRSCSGLESIVVSPDHPALAVIDGVLFSKEDMRLICYPHWLTASSYEIPQGVAVIGDEAFYYCGSLSSITIPDSVTAIGDQAFAHCWSLSSVTIPDSVITIGANPFSGCRSLISIVVSPDNPSLAMIDGVLFSKEDKRLVYYPSRLTASFYDIPQGIITIGEEAFYDCDSLSSVTLPNSVTTIGAKAFLGCSRLSSVTIPDSVTSIGDSAFYDCDSLSSVTIPDRVTSIGDQVFRGCSNLSTVTIPDRVTSIGKRAFWCCSSLSTITIPDRVTSIGDYAFSGCSSLISVTIPDRVTSIGDQVFCGCRSLISVTIPDSVTYIGNYAFSECVSLRSVTIPNSVTTIGKRAFSGCSSLVSIVVSPDHPALAVMDGVLFSKADKRLVCYPCGLAASSYEIPQGIVIIGEYAFPFCDNLSTITIPDSVTTIEKNAFYVCDNLSSITIPESVTSIGKGAFVLCDSLETIIVGWDSYALEYCKENGLPYSYADAND